MPLHHFLFYQFQRAIKFKKQVNMNLIVYDTYQMKVMLYPFTIYRLMTSKLDESKPEVLDYSSPSNAKIQENILKQKQTQKKENKQTINQLTIENTELIKSQQTIRQLSKRLIGLSKQNLQFLTQNENLKQEDIPKREQKISELIIQKQQMCKNAQILQQQLKIMKDQLAQTKESNKNLKNQVNIYKAKYHLKKQKNIDIQNKMQQLGSENIKLKIRMAELNAICKIKNMQNIDSKNTKQNQ